MDLVIRNARIFDSNESNDIGIQDGGIAKIGGVEAEGEDVIELD